MSWTQQQAINLCRVLETVAPNYGAHVALTGGTLYNYGTRKDVDILIYRIRQVPEIDVEGFLSDLGSFGFTIGRDAGWCVKCTYEDRAVDLFFPERSERSMEHVDPAIREWYIL